MFAGASHTHIRPRVEGAREDQILETALQLLASVGYDNLTMDAIASAARASKATLYRRWSSKVELVVEALDRMKAHGEKELADTGSLRADLLAAACDAGGVTDEFALSVLGSIVTAIQHDEEFAVAFRERFVAKRVAYQRRIFQRAIERGELPASIDIDSLLFVLPAMCLHQAYVLGLDVSAETVRRYVDDVVMPAVEHQVRQLERSTARSSPPESSAVAEPKRSDKNEDNREKEGIIHD
jgi:AcrR family transcriptional regulator